MCFNTVALYLSSFNLTIHHLNYLVHSWLGQFSFGSSVFHIRSQNNLCLKHSLAYCLKRETIILIMNPFTCVGNFEAIGFRHAAFFHSCAIILTIRRFSSSLQCWESASHSFAADVILLWHHTSDFIVKKRSWITWTKCLWMDIFTTQVFLLTKGNSYFTPNSYN